MVRVKQLIVIAGPGCAGKTFLMEQLRRGGKPSLPDGLEMGDIASWKFCYANRLDDGEGSPVERMVLHYDIGRYWKFNLQAGFREDRPLAILDRAEDTSILTLWAPASVLLKRHRMRIRREYRERLRRRPLATLYRFGTLADQDEIRCFRKTRRFYKSGRGLLGLYQKWFAFCERYDLGAHWVVNTAEEEFHYISVDRGRCVVERLLRASGGGTRV